MKRYIFELMTKYDEPNDRGVIISKEEIKKAINKKSFIDKVSTGGMHVLLDGTPSSEFSYNVVSLENVVGRIISINLDENIALAEIDTDKLNQICPDIDIDDFGLMSRAIGIIDDKNYAHSMTILSYQLNAIDWEDWEQNYSEDDIDYDELPLTPID